LTKLDISRYDDLICKQHKLSFMSIDNIRITTFQELPVSLAAQACKWGCEQDWLHPPNANQGFLSRTVGYVLIRPVLRFIYSVAVGILISPVGIIHHSSSAFYNAFKNKQRAVEHLKAAFEDILFLLFFSFCPVGAMDFASGGYWKTRERLGRGDYYDSEHGTLYFTGSLYPSTLIKDEDNPEGPPICCDDFVHRRLYATRL